MVKIITSKKDLEILILQNPMYNNINFDCNYKPIKINFKTHYVKIVIGNNITTLTINKND